MLQTINALFQLRTYSWVNRLLYYATKLPGIGRLIPPVVYARSGVKGLLSVIVWIATVLFAFANKFAYLWLMAVLPAMSSRPDAAGEQLALALHAFLLLSLIAAGVSSANMLETKREKYVAVKLVRMSPGAYMRTTLAYRYITYFVSFVPALAVLLGALGLTFPEALSLAVTVTAWRVLCEYAHLKLFEKTGIVLIRKNGPVWLTIAVCAVAAYAPFFHDGLPTAGMLLLEWPVAAGIALAGLLAAVALAKYKEYRPVVDAATKKDDPLLDLGKAMAEAQKTAAKAKDSDYTATEDQTAKASSKQGYDYLHTLFFARHRSLVRQPFLRRIAGLSGFGAVGAAVVLLAGDRLAPYVVDLADNASRYLVFLMFFLSLGEIMSRAFFYHCDIHLMRYSFFRRDARLHFRYRLFRLAGYNLAVGALLAAALTLIFLLAGGVPGSIYALVWINALMLAVFFAVHHMAMYYLFQPYSTELNAKNPYYHVINIGVSAACGASFFAPIPPVALTWIICILTPVYLAAAFLLVRRFAERTFRVK